MYCCCCCVQSYRVCVRPNDRVVSVTVVVYISLHICDIDRRNPASPSPSSSSDFFVVVCILYTSLCYRVQSLPLFVASSPSLCIKQLFLLYTTQIIYTTHTNNIIVSAAAAVVALGQPAKQKVAVEPLLSPAYVYM